MNTVNNILQWAAVVTGGTGIIIASFIFSAWLVIQILAGLTGAAI